ncbi:glycoside hydrolase family 15 protein [Halorubrum vacuolatum]|uniref:Glucan 1,4-alpha-glucosidase n=1 Tax=Halorubrum vacuolatum TaxID=63740 RepID=A0A238UPE5_HALVU|nr:glycoside hydrolase family 15 protein [Halorubrum vacuolatum]SNR23811.1 glucan 1,4-alpha-glucosidase [Halorubrum vacuolatum]
MRLRTALTEHKRRHGERFPAERSTTTGAFTGDGERLVYIGRHGTIHDCSYPLSGIGGIDRLRLGILAGGSVRWFDGLAATRQHYDDDTPLVETEYDAGRYTVHQFDITVEGTHLTHVELRGAPPADAELVVACSFAPDLAEGRVGNIVHREAGPADGHVIEVFHRAEHDFLTASTGLSSAHGQRQDSLSDLLGRDDNGFPRRGEIDDHEASHLTGDVIARAPFEREGRTERVTVATDTVLADPDARDANGRAREGWIADISEAAATYSAADDLREAAEARGPTVPEDAPRRPLLAADLRTLDLLTASSGARIAGPDFDPFYSNSGGYGYTWFRDDAEVSNALLAASAELDLPADEELSTTADFFCATQDADGSWPHRVWADSGTVAPGWANARIEGPDGDVGPDDQLDQPAAVVAFLARLRRTTDLDEQRRDRVDAAIADAVDFLIETCEEDGLPRACQNCWENAIGRFTHTGATYLRAFAAVARAPVDDDLRARAATAADAALLGLDGRWIPESDRFPQRASEESRDTRADSSTFGLVDGLIEYAALAEERADGEDGEDGTETLPPIDGDVDLETFVDRVRTHVRTTIDALRHETADVEGLVRFVGDDWRVEEQGHAKVWSVATLWGALAAAELGGFLVERGESGDSLFSVARELYTLCEPKGPLTNEAGLLAEQVFDNGDLDSATPLGWSHALRLHATVTLARHGKLPVPSERPTGPEAAPQWTTGRKFGVATPADHGEEDPVPIWFTLTEGALTEARFPRIDVMNLRTFDFLIADPETDYTVRTFDETRHVTMTETIERTTEPADDQALAYTQTITETGDGHGHEWTLTVEYAIDVDGQALLADVSFEGCREYDIYAVADTTLGNVGVDDYGRRVPAVDPEATPASDDIEAITAAGDLTDGGTVPAAQSAEPNTDTGAYHLIARNAHPDREPGKIVDADGDPFEVALALASASRFEWATAAHAGDESLRTLFTTGERDDGADEATGNLVLAGLVGSGERVSDTLALGFAERADTAAALGEAEGALARPFREVADDYAATWHDWLAGREYPDSVAGDPDLEAQYRFALMTLAAVEDKRHAGAGIASPSVPWGETEHAAEDRGYGYNFVWSRDLYQVFTALVEVGEIERSADALAYLYNTQQDDDGFLPQNTYINGRTRWGGEQMDNIAFPSVMAWQLYEHGVTLTDADYTYDQVRRSLGYVSRNGPETAQERWEEEAGFSPSSIAAEIAGLVCGAALALAEAERVDADGSADLDAAGLPEDPDSLRADALAWLALADDWAERVEEWCATETGTDRHTETPYYLRITADGDPESGRPRTIANDGPTYDEREIIDGGFLELVRLGVKPADDPIVRNSVSVVDDSIRVDTPYGPGWYRYVGDAYGEISTGDPGAPWAGTGGGKGRLWPIFTGERGEYELRARADGPDAFGGTDEEALEPEALLETMAGFGNSGRMLPEQVWDREHPTEYGWEFGEGTGGATPLAWSMAGFIRLAHGIDAGVPVETPAVARERYVERDRPDGPELTATVEPTEDGHRIVGETTGDRVAVHGRAGGLLVEPDADGTYEVALGTDYDGDVVTIAAVDGDVATGGTTVEREYV